MSLVDLGKRLLDAAKTGLTEEVRTLMSNGAPFTTDWLGTSPLHFACMNGHLATSEVLLRAGISRDARTKVDRTPLHVASQEGHFDIVELLIRNGADVDAKDMLKMTPLHWAVEMGHTEVIQYLLQHGAEVHTQNKFEKSPLDIAFSNRRGDIANLLQQNVVEVSTSAEDHPYVGEVTEVGEAEAETIAATESVALAGEEVVTPVTFISSTLGDTKRDISSPQMSNSILQPADTDNSVLATGCALTSSSDADTIKWLESQGITMLSADNSTIVGNSIENGQSLTLTEAGKLALNQIVKDKTAISTDQGVVIVTSDAIHSSINQDIATAVSSEIDTVDYEPSLKRIKLEKGDVLAGEEEEEEEGGLGGGGDLVGEGEQTEEEVPLSSEMGIKLEQSTVEEMGGVEQVPIEYVGEEVNEYVNHEPHEYVNEDPNEFVSEEANEYVIVHQEFAVAEDEVS